MEITLMRNKTRTARGTQRQAAFMEPSIEQGTWIEIDGPRGGETIPAIEISADEVETLKQEIEANGEASLEGTSLQDFADNTVITSIETVEGYSAYLSAPGYMDRTENAVFPTVEEAKDYLLEQYPESFEVGIKVLELAEELGIDTKGLEDYQIEEEMGDELFRLVAFEEASDDVVENWLRTYLKQPATEDSPRTSSARSHRADVPAWPGADIVYSRVQDLLSRLNREEAEAQLRAHIKKGRQRNTFRYNPPDEIRDIVEALGKGDEEFLKTTLGRYHDQIDFSKGREGSHRRLAALAFKNYEEAWAVAKPLLEAKMSAVVAALQPLAAELEHEGYNAKVVSYPVDTSDDYMLLCALEITEHGRVSELSVDVDIALVDAASHEGLDPSDPSWGVNISIDITSANGDGIGGYTPENYTEAVWTRDPDQLEERIASIDPDEVASTVTDWYNENL